MTKTYKTPSPENIQRARKATLMISYDANEECFMAQPLDWNTYGVEIEDCEPSGGGLTEQEAIDNCRKEMADLLEGSGTRTWEFLKSIKPIGS